MSPAIGLRGTDEMTAEAAVATVEKIVLSSRERAMIDLDSEEIWASEWVTRMRPKKLKTEVQVRERVA